MSNEDSTTPTTEDTEGHAVRRIKVDEPATEKDDTDAHVQLRAIKDTRTDDDTEGNRLK